MKIGRGFLVGLILLLLLAVVGCSNQSKGSDGSSSGASGGSEGQSNAPRKVQLVMWALDNPDGRHKVTQSFIDEWNAENPDIQVKFEAIPADQYMGEKLSAAMMSGTGPDIFFLSRGDFLKFVESGLVHPLDEWFTEERRQDFLPLVLEAVTYQGKIMTYPMEMDPVALFYDKQVFAENNLQPPQTWDELVDIAVKLTTKDRYGIYLAPTANAVQNFLFSPFLWQAGADFANEDLTESRFNGPGAVQAIQLWKTLSETGATPQTAMNEPLGNGLAAMEVAGSYKISAYMKNFPEFYENRMGIAPLPIPQGGKKLTVYGGWGLALNAKSKHINEAAKFLMWYFSEPERAVRWNVEARISISPQKSIRETEAHSSFWSGEKVNALLDIFETARGEAAMPPEIVKIVQDAIAAAYAGQGTAEEIVQKADEEINKYLKSRNQK